MDDIIAVYTPRHKIKYQKFEKELLSAYEIRSLGDLKNFLGIRVLRDRSQRKLWLSVDSYIEKIANRFSIPLNIKPPHTPLPFTADLTPLNTQASIGQIRLY